MPLSFFLILNLQAERKVYEKVTHFSLQSFSLTMSYLVSDIFHFVGLTPPTFPFQFRTAQVGVSMLKECNTCVCVILHEAVVCCVKMSDFLSPSHHLPPSPQATSWLMLHQPHLMCVELGFLIIHHHNLFIEVMFFSVLHSNL